MTQPTTEYVVFSREIDENSVRELIITVGQILSRRNKVYLAINSPGGNVSAGIYCYNTLRGICPDMIMHNVGHVDSISNVIFLAGEQRFSCPSSTFLFHGVAHTPKGSISLSRTREILNLIETDHQRIAEIMSVHTSISEQTAVKMMEEERVYPAEWAKQNGFIEEICEFSVSPEFSIHIQS